MLDKLDILRAMHEMESVLEHRLTTYVDNQMTSYRQSIIRQKDEWCCTNMTDFATDVFGLPTPKHVNSDGLGQLSIKLRGYDLIYCPFCGVKL